MPKKDSNPETNIKVEGRSNYVNVKNVVLKHLARFKKDLKNDKIELEPVNLGRASSMAIAALELKKKEQDAEESPELEGQREKVVSMVQELVEGIQDNGEKVVVVNVNTPAVDLDKKFNEDQLNFMKKDIFNSIEEQLGVKFQNEVEEQWEDAFAAMMEIVQTQRSNLRE